jgi:hypothetical protein
MKKTILTFGLICGAIMSIMMAATVPFHDQIGFDKGLLIGYTTMVLAFLLVYFGIRSYRDNVGRGSISFGRAVAVGMLITLVGSLCYTATWEVLYFNFLPDFTTKYIQAEVARARAKGKRDAEVAQVQAKLESNFANYDNPVVNSAYTILEPLPVGLIVTLVSAGVLRRKRRGQDAVLATA